jgi:hypothetical protein
LGWEGMLKVCLPPILISHLIYIYVEQGLGCLSRKVMRWWLLEPPFHTNYFTAVAHLN